MKIVSLSEISTTAFSISSPRILKRRPNYTKLLTKKRLVNGFFFLEEGACVYSWSGGQVHLRPGALLYLPLDSCHRMDAVSEHIAYTAIDFILKDQDDEIILFSEKPVLVSKNVGAFFTGYIQRMADEYLESADNFKNIAIISLFLSEICAQKTVVNKKIIPAISYINNNLLESVDGETLADICRLSKAQMYRLFKEQTGMTPTAYRNQKRIEKACQMLSTKEYYVYEVASKLGFENIGYFNRVFKEHMGLSPKDYLA